VAFFFISPFIIFPSPKIAYRLFELLVLLAFVLALLWRYFLEEGGLTTKLKKQ